MDIRQQYYNIAKKQVEDYSPIILKTDSWNEAENAFPIIFPNTYYIEIDPEIVKKARERYPDISHKILQGDIRKLPFSDLLFDLIFDFSTIDHIPDYEVALKEYKRVLKGSGKLVLVAWVSNENRQVQETPGASWTQYYFKRDEFENAVYDIFHVADKEVLIDRGNDKLIKYICVK